MSAFIITDSNMENILIKFFKNKIKCTHKNALLYTNEGYCPDCGEYLVKNYYIVRCSRCDIKRQAKLSFGEIVPLNKYCCNCGSKEYYIEKLDKVNFIDANYAIYLKEIADNIKILHPEAQVWVEDENNFEDKIIKRITLKMV